MGYSQQWWITYIQTLLQYIYWIDARGDVFDCFLVLTLLGMYRMRRKWRYAMWFPSVAAILFYLAQFVRHLA